MKPKHKKKEKKIKSNESCCWPKCRKSRSSNSDNDSGPVKQNENSLHSFESKVLNNRVVNTNTATTVIGGGVNCVMKSSFVPPQAKAALAVGKVLYKGVEAYVDTGDLSQVRMAVQDTSYKSIQDVVPGVDLARIASDLAKDIYDGKDLKSAISQRGGEALSSVGGDVAKIAFDATSDIRKGESIQNVIVKNSKAALVNYAENDPNLKSAMNILDKTKTVLNSDANAINSLIETNFMNNEYLKEEANILNNMQSYKPLSNFDDNTAKVILGMMQDITDSANIQSVVSKNDKAASSNYTGYDANVNSLPGSEVKKDD